MSDKQWHALMNKVDSAINTQHQAVKADCSITNDENEQPYNDDFAAILKKKESSQLSIKDFLSSLTSDELYIIQKANGLASQINVNKLSDEGAENLFLRPLGEDKVVDLNNDGIEEVGEAKMVFFPPSNAPDSVKKAWAEGTSGLSSEDKMHILFNFIAKQLESNYYIDANGNAAERKPGEAGWKNIFGNTEESYINLFNSIIDRIDNPLGARDSKQIKEDELAKRVLTDVINLIRK